MDILTHEYSPEAVAGQDFKKIFASLMQGFTPLFLLVTQREGRSINLAQPRSLYLRMDVSEKKLQWSINTEPYILGQHVWDQDVHCAHIHMDNTHFFVGPDYNRLNPEFLTQLESLLGVDPIPWNCVILVGAWNDIRWFCCPASPRGSKENGESAYSDTIGHFQAMAGKQLDSLYSAFRSHKPVVATELVVLGTG
jgi:hypothetical protein